MGPQVVEKEHILVDGMTVQCQAKEEYSVQIGLE